MKCCIFSCIKFNLASSKSSIPQPIDFLGQITVFPHYSVLNKVKELPQGLNEVLYYELAIFMNERPEIGTVTHSQLLILMARQRLNLYIILKTQ